MEEDEIDSASEYVCDMCPGFYKKKKKLRQHKARIHTLKIAKDHQCQREHQWKEKKWKISSFAIGVNLVLPEQIR